MTVLVRAGCRGFHSSQAEQNLGFRASRTRNTVTFMIRHFDNSQSPAKFHFPDVLRT
jgi:hypothetical protein